MADMVYTGPIDDIDALVASCQFAPDTYVLVEQAPRHVVTGEKERLNLLRFTYLGKIDASTRLSNYTSGRVFTGEFELRWERMEQHNGQFQVIYVGPERGHLPLTWNEEQSKKLGKLRDTNYFLFGERLDADDIEAIGPPAQEGDFAQLRIPRLLRYPRLLDGQTPRRLKLKVSEYVDEETGEVRLFRFRALEPEE